MIEIIFSALVAAFVVRHLLRILGREDEVDVQKSQAIKENIAAQENIVVKDANFEEISIKEAKLESQLSEKLKASVAEVKNLDSSFCLTNFFQGTKKAFSMILKALSDSDMQTLKMLLNQKVFKIFTQTIEQRNKSGLIYDVSLIGVKSTKIIDIILQKKLASIKVEIISDQIKVIKNKEGVIIEGSVKKILQIKDNWTFVKDLSDRNDFWHLTETS